MSASPLRLLVVTYAFPPRGGVAVQRMLHLVRHLPAQGIESTVLTVTPPRGTVQADVSLLDLVPQDLRVIRTPALEPYRLYRALGGQRAQDDPRNRAALTAGGGSRSLPERVYGLVQDRWLVPDAKIGWFPFALDAARAWAMEQGPADVVLATQPPATALVAGAAIAREWGCPLVADYRDPWTAGYYPQERPAAVSARERALERRVLAKAAAVVTVGESFAGILRELVEESGDNRDKVTVISNGFEPESYMNIKPLDFQHPAIVHTGSLYHQRSPLPFFEAFAALQQEQPALTDGWQVHLYGNVDPAFLTAAKALGLTQIHHEGFVDQRTALAAQAGADLLLLCSEGMLTAKVYEYLQARKPVLALGDSPELAALLDSYGAGVCLRPSDAEGIKAALAAMLQRKSGGPLTLRRDPAEHAWSARVAEYAALLHRTAGTYTPMPDA